MPERISVVGTVPPVGEPASVLAPAARRAIEGADLVIGAPRQLAALRARGRRLELWGDLSEVLDAVAAEPGRVCVLASGDPGFFGIVRPLAERFGRGVLDVHPAQSSVSLAFARLGLPWDDASVVSAHGRSLARAARAAASRTKSAVLVSPASPPEALGKELVELGARFSTVAVCSRLGGRDEAVRIVSLEELAAGTWDPMSVVVLLKGTGVSDEATLEWGSPEQAFAHRSRMITKSEVRAVALGKLRLPADGVIWDVGAGSGSVSVECARLCPALEIYAVEQDPEAASLVRANCTTHGVHVNVVSGRAPSALDSLPEPDRAFVGGGGMAVLDTVLERLRPGGRVVAAYAALERAAQAEQRLGNLVQIAVSRGRRLPDGSPRLEAENPVFIAWGPGGEPGP